MNITPSYESYTLSQLGKLRYYLKYELSASFLYLLSYFGAILLVIASAAALIFIPFMIKVLIKEKKYGWILTFIFLIGTPLFLAIIFREIIIVFITLALFYLYCFLLKITVDDWFEERKNKFERELKMHKKNEDFLNSISMR